MLLLGLQFPICIGPFPGNTQQIFIQPLLVGTFGLCRPQRSSPLFYRLLMLLRHLSQFSFIFLFIIIRLASFLPGFLFRLGDFPQKSIILLQGQDHMSTLRVRVATVQRFISHYCLFYELAHGSPSL